MYTLDGGKGEMVGIRWNRLKEGGDGVDQVGLERHVTDYVTIDQINACLKFIIEQYVAYIDINTEDLFETIRSTEFYQSLPRFTIGEICNFLCGMRNINCGFAHEEIQLTTRQRVMPLTVGTCNGKIRNASCGHPEANGTLIALAIGLALMLRTNPTQEPDTQAIFITLGLVILDIKRNGLENNKFNGMEPDGYAEQLKSIQTQQGSGGERLRIKCHELGEALRAAYQNPPN